MLRLRTLEAWACASGMPAPTNVCWSTEARCGICHDDSTAMASPHWPFSGRFLPRLRAAHIGRPIFCLGGGLLAATPSPSKHHLSLLVERWRFCAQSSWFGDDHAEGGDTRGLISTKSIRACPVDRPRAVPMEWFRAFGTSSSSVSDPTGTIQSDEWTLRLQNSSRWADRTSTIMQKCWV